MNKLILMTLFITFFNCEITNIDYLKPIISTNEPSSILTNSAVLGGKVLGEGGKDITEYGVVWSQTFPPTSDDNKMIEGERIDWFSKRYEGLMSNTTYYYSAYGINEVGVGYGEIYEFTTNAEPSCTPITNNRLDLGEEILDIGNVVFTNESLGFYDGNIQFQTRSSYSTAYVTLNFKEKNGELPLTGEYTTIREFDSESKQSDGEVMLGISDWGFGKLGGGYAANDQKIYVENDGLNNITFIFCDINVGESKYTLNGKYTYNP